ncbi:DNA-processing protein DprA [Albimonas sp. CAU 1670]|uniref:DNA-processing protein DprA n=1 Tax=Albimonas sp. CAU 1670 TaxID=3032599 RepID=UPI0023DA8C26|nr:DNA-processing protein DprA [Albimonas sp. CAU 1670]MDF2232352.1 DNA-processing protein DprA [Albimonas sp. CAU 1670]
MQPRLDLSRPATPVPAPPPATLSEAEALDALRLARSRNVGPSTWVRLVRRFGTPARALDALPGLAGRGGASGVTVASLAQAERELGAGLSAGARLLVWDRPGYPEALARIPDPPPVLWVRGDPAALMRPAVAIVGARNASAVGLRVARLLAAELGRKGLWTVSGLARGVDGAAHDAALSAAGDGGGTVAAVAGCVQAVYPSEHAELAGRIAQGGGAVVSEAPIGLAPQGRHFPRRNRVIAGLSRAVILIEAAARSGSLITAEFALEQGREVLAVPGSPLDPRSEGGNALIRQGAALVRHAEDVIEALEAAAALPDLAPALPEPEAAPDPEPGTPDAPGLADPGAGFARPPLSAAQRDAALRAQVRELLGLAPVEEDELARLSGAPLSALADVLLELELAGRLDRRPGGLVALLPE